MTEKNFSQKLLQHAAQLNGGSSFIAKKRLFKAYCEDTKYHPFDEEKSHLLPEESEIGFLIANNSSKKSPGGRKKMIRSDCETVVVFIQNSDEADQCMSRKLDFKRQNAEGYHGRQKNGIVLIWLVLRKQESH